MSQTAQTQTRNYQTSHFGLHDSFIAQPDEPNDRIDDHALEGEMSLCFHPALRPDDELIDLDYLAHFIDGTAFYAEALEDELGEMLEDFWQAREHAHHIVTTLLLQRLSECGIDD